MTVKVSIAYQWDSQWQQRTGTQADCSFKAAMNGTLRRETGSRICSRFPAKVLMQYLLFCVIHKHHTAVWQSLIHRFIPPPITVEGRHTLLDTLLIPHKTAPSVLCQLLYIKSFLWDTVGTHCPAQLIPSGSQPCLLCPDGTEGLWFLVLEACLPKKSGS